MKSVRLSLLACALASFPATAQEAPLRSGNWEMLREGGACAARIAGTGGAALTVWQQADGTQSVLLTGQTITAQPLRIAVMPSRVLGQKKQPKEIRFDVSGEPDAQGARVKAEPGLTLSFWGADLIGVQPRKKRAPIAAFAPGPDGMPDQELRRCRKETARIDRGSGKPKVTAGASLVPPARIITSDDYPWQALRSEWTGRTTLQLTVSAKGLVSGCSISASSGHAILDQKACILYSRRARFSPARDADGAPTEALYLAPVLWMIPQ